LVEEATVGIPGLDVRPMLPSSGDQRGNDPAINLRGFTHSGKNVDGWNRAHSRQRGTSHVLECNHHRQLKFE